jgi:hypothetical protein
MMSAAVLLVAFIVSTIGTWGLLVFLAGACSVFITFACLAVTYMQAEHDRVYTVVARGEALGNPALA